MPKWSDLSPDERSEAISLFVAGEGYDSLFKKFKITNPITASRKLRLHRRKSQAGKQLNIKAVCSDVPQLTDVDSAVLELLRGRNDVGLIELADKVNLPPAKVLECVARLCSAGYVIRQSDTSVQIPRQPESGGQIVSPLWNEKAGHFVWAAISDTHFGSRYVQKTALHDFVHIATEQYGVKVILHSGDLVAGQNVYRGQEYDLYAVGADEQLDDALNGLPEAPGLKYYVIGGNHDLSFVKASGMDVVRRASLMRQDIVWCGWDVADVRLTSNSAVRLWHPSGGGAYAISYKGQRYSSQIAYEELQNIVFSDGSPPAHIRVLQIGHLHVLGGPVCQGALDFFMAGTFEAQTPFLRRLGLSPNIGAYIFEASITQSGILRELTIHCLKFAPQTEDWRGYATPQRVSFEQGAVIGPVFCWSEGDGTIPDSPAT